MTESNRKEKDKLVTTVSVLSGKILEMTSNLDETICELEQSQDQDCADKSMEVIETEVQCLAK